MQNVARNVVVQLKFKDSREGVIVIVRRSIVDMRFRGGVAELFAARFRRFDALKIADVFPPGRVPLNRRLIACVDVRLPVRHGSGTVLGQFTISGPGLRMFIGEPQEHKAGNRH